MYILNFESGLNFKSGTKTFLYACLFFITLAGELAQAANITVSSSRNPVSLDDSFHLIYEADSSVDDDPDFAPIYQHFDVLSSSQSTNMRSVNGNWSLKKTWDLSVIAKDVGTVTVPAISFGKDTSPAIRITVKNSTSSNNGASSPGTSNNGTSNNQATIPAKLFVEASVDNETSWIQSQIIYTVRLFRTVNLIGASITEPTTSDPDAIIEALSEDDYQSTRNGIRYNVFERQYAIFPQKSGALKINPVTFEGRVQATQPRSIFDQFRMSGQLKRLRTKAITVKVKAAPTQVNLQDWLPASNLTLIENWSGDINNIKAGEPITRTVTIVAQGLSAVQLPELSFEDKKDLKQYPDKSVTENRKDSAGITGLKQIKVALIPASAGSYTLPEIKLEWWNTTTNKKELATLPATTLTVTGTVTENTYTTPPSQNTLTENAQEPADKQSSQPVATTDSSTEPFWKWTSLLFAIAWLITLFLYFKKPGQASMDNETENHQSTASVKSLAAKVKRHANKGDGHETRLALIAWARVFYDDETITNLSQIAQRCSAPLAQAVKQLDQSLYSPESPKWQSKELLSAFTDEQSVNPIQSEAQPPALKPLYGR
jgi:hypothetical protein